MATWGRLLGALILLSLSATPHEALGNWGQAVGRATPADANRLELAKIALKEAESQYNTRVIAVQRMMVTERQLQLLGLSSSDVLALYDRVYLWWLRSVLEPAALIATNPAATCAEATMGVQRFLAMQRQRQLIGLARDPNDPNPETTTRDEENTLLDQIGEEVFEASERRCHEEALDECVDTGRFMAVFEMALSEMRRAQLLGYARSDTEWVKDALAQCAVYRLKFESTGHRNADKRIPGYKRAVEGTVVLRFHESDAPFLALFPEIGALGGTTASSGGSPPDEDAAASNPFLTSHDCLPGGSSPFKLKIVGCGPGSANAARPAEAVVRALDLRHLVYELDANEQVTRRAAGKDTLVFEFSPGHVRLPLTGVWTARGTSSDPFDMLLEVFEDSYESSHRSDPGFPAISIERAGNDVAVDALEHPGRRSQYPELLATTIKGKCTGKPACADETRFVLTHAPEPLPFAPPDTQLAAKIERLIAEALNRTEEL